MTVDIHQLPIPDWGLTCPQCRYALAGLSHYRCPECGHDFRIEEVVHTWTRLRDPRFDGSELPLPDFGLACGRCGSPLAGAGSRRCGACEEPFDPRMWLPEATWFTVDRQFAEPVPLPWFEAALAAEQVPFTYLPGRMLRELLGGAGGQLGRPLSVPTEFYFEVRWLLRQAMRRMERARGQTTEWTCDACEEQVPEHFDVCWNCGTER